MQKQWLWLMFLLIPFHHGIINHPKEVNELFVRLEAQNHFVDGEKFVAILCLCEVRVRFQVTGAMLSG
jgi:hypothetical protein